MNWNTLRQSHKGHRYFWTIVPRETQFGKTGVAYRGFVLLSRFLNTTRVLDMAHRTEKNPGRSTSIWRQIFRQIQQLDDQPPQRTWLFPVLGSDGCSKLCVGTASPPLGAASPPQWASLAQKVDFLNGSLSSPQNLPEAASKGPRQPLRPLRHPLWDCAAPPGAALPLCYVFFGLGLKFPCRRPLHAFS